MPRMSSSVVEAPPGRAPSHSETSPETACDCSCAATRGAVSMRRRYSIAVSARSMSAVGSARPMARAVLTLTTSSKGGGDRDRQVARRGSAEHALDIGGELTRLFDAVRPVGDDATRLDELAPRRDDGPSALACDFGAGAQLDGEAGRDDAQGLGAALRRGGKRRFGGDAITVPSEFYEDHRARFWTLYK